MVSVRDFYYSIRRSEKICMYPNHKDSDYLSVVFVSDSQLLAMTANLFDNQMTRCNNAHFAYNA